jgi:nucleotide-binding universal stress UspA family protein
MRTELYVGALPYSVSEAQLQEIFLAHGTVESSRVIKGRFTGQSRGFGFVVMSSQAEAGKAIEALNDTQVQGRTIVVREARPQMIRKILCPTDFSSHSKAGIAYAISLAQENSAELLFLHVDSLTAYHAYQLSSLTAYQGYQLTPFHQGKLKRSHVPEFSIAKLLAEKTFQLDQFVRYNFGSQMRQLRWHAEISLGNVATEIVRVAAQKDVDLIVVAKEKRGIMSLFSRSISKSISRRGHCPVVSIRPPLKGSSWRGRSWPAFGNVPQVS